MKSTSYSCKLLQHVKQYRLTHRLSQKELRVQSNTSASAFSKLENGQRQAKVDEILTLISALDITAIEFIYWLTDAGVNFRELKHTEPHNFESVMQALREHILSFESPLKRAV